MSEYRLEDGSEPELLDVIELELDSPAPTARQPENWKLGVGLWRRVRKLSRDEATGTLDGLLLPDELLFGTPSGSLSVEDLEQSPIGYSLTIVRPAGLMWEETTGYRGGRQVRAHFALGSTRYDLAVTDPAWLARLGEQERGYHRAEELMPETEFFFTVSLADELPGSGKCFKLVAGVITFDR